MNQQQLKLRTQYPTYKQFVSEVDPGSLLASFADINTIQESIKKKRVSIEDIQITYSDQENGEAGVRFIRDWLRALQRFLSIKDGLLEESAVAYMIYKTYKHLYLADLKLLQEKIVLAEYGKYALFYNSMEAQKILYSFSMYNYDRHCVINKKAEEIQLRYEAIEKQYRDKFKDIIHERVVADGFRDGAKYEEFKRRLNIELPKMIWEKMKEEDEENSQE